MADDQWDKRADGNLVVQPVLGYAFAKLPKAALLRVIYAATQEDFEAQKASAVQLAMTPPIARAMARMLDQIADAIEPPPAGFTVEAPSAGLPASPGGSPAPPITPTARPEPAGGFGYSIGDDPEELNFTYRD